jgi:hypothetical protein
MLQSVLHYAAGYSSRSMEFFGFKSGKTLLQFKIDCSLTRCHLSHRPA